MNNQIETQGQSSITFDKEKYLFLKRCVKLAKRKNEKDFVFDGVLLLTEYADHLLQFLKPNFEE